MLKVSTLLSYICNHCRTAALSPTTAFFISSSIPMGTMKSYKYVLAVETTDLIPEKTAPLYIFLGFERQQVLRYFPPNTGLEKSIGCLGLQL